MPSFFAQGVLVLWLELFFSVDGGEMDGGVGISGAGTAGPQLLASENQIALSYVLGEPSRQQVTQLQSSS